MNKNGSGEDKTGLWRSLVGADRKIRIILAVGLSGMLLILISSLFTDTPAKSAGAAKSATETTDAQYVVQLEERMLRLVASIDGVGKANVLVTLESGREYVYARELKSSSSRSASYEGGQPSKSEESANGEQKYLLMDVNGGDQALLLTQVEPKIKGVVVVCEGAGNPVVSQRVISAVTTALGISSTRVCVIKIAS
jgi:stage III sporulation protein AG